MNSLNANNTLQTCQRSFISFFSNCMAVSLISKYDLFQTFLSMESLENVVESRQSCDVVLMSFWLTLNSYYNFSSVFTVDFEQLYVHRLVSSVFFSTFFGDCYMQHMALQFVFNGCWKLAVTGQTSSQAVVKITLVTESL